MDTMMTFATSNIGDQAAGLRRIFAQRGVRLLPVLVPETRGESRAVWLSKLAEGFARHGNRTLLIDAARVQMAAAIGLRARYDLLHALRGECAVSAVLLDAAPGLTVLPAARALEQAAHTHMSLAQLLGACLASGRSFDLVLLLLPAPFAALLPAGDMLVPVQPTRNDVAAVLGEIRRANELADKVEFRLLFLGIEDAAAATLSRRMIASAALWSTAEVSFGGAALVARDLARVVRTVGTWNLAQLKPQMESLT
jgi:flagellar biosynthesis protein FlhG